VELLIARNPDTESSLPYLIRVPLDGGLVLATKGTWPRTGALYCHPAADGWPETPEIIERLALRACARRGAAIDVICDRDREQRSQIVFTRARGRDVIFWQSPRTRKQARPEVRLPTARAQALGDLEIIVDAHERYPFRFAHQQARTVRRGLACGDYAVSVSDAIAAAVERKSVVDLVSSLTSGRLRYQLAELASLPRAAIVVEEGYGRLFKLEHVRGAMVADGLAEAQIRWPSVPIVFCESRKLAEEWTYRFLAAGRLWAEHEPATLARIAAAGPGGRATPAPPPGAPALPALATDVRAWARAQGLTVADRGRIGAAVLRAWEAAHTAEPDGAP
jgi:hypothetical protein